MRSVLRLLLGGTQSENGALPTPLADTPTHLLSLQDLLDEHCADYGEAKAMYVEAMRCEFNFFDGASSARLG